MSWVYFIQHGGPAGAIKIGTTTQNPLARLRDLQTGAPEPLRLLAAFVGGPVEERQLHERFASARVRSDGEWFRAAPEVLGFVDGVKYASAVRPPPPPDIEATEDLFGLKAEQVEALIGAAAALVFSIADGHFAQGEYMTRDDKDSPAYRKCREACAEIEFLRGEMLARFGTDSPQVDGARWVAAADFDPLITEMG